MLHYRKYYIEKHKPWVTFIHGAGGSSTIWHKQVKEYRKHFNVLLIDLRGHGKSKNTKWKENDTFEEIAEEVINVLDQEGINKSHFVGISLGSIIIQTIAYKHNERINTMLLGGAVTELNIRCRVLLLGAHLVKHIIPFIWLYRLFAWIMMPRHHHRTARCTFVKEASKMEQQEFLRWFSLTKNVRPYLNTLQKDFHDIPTLFVVGEEDYLFMEAVEDIVLLRSNTVGLASIENAGHLCNLDKPEEFNEIGIDFIYRNSEVVSPVMIS